MYQRQEPISSEFRQKTYVWTSVGCEVEHLCCKQGWQLLGFTNKYLWELKHFEQLGFSPCFFCLLALSPLPVVFLHQWDIWR